MPLQTAHAAAVACNTYPFSFTENFSSASTEFNYRSTLLGWGSNGPLTLGYKFGVFPTSSANPRYGSVGMRIIAAGDGQGNITRQAEETAVLIDYPTCKVQWFAQSNYTGTYSGSFINAAYTFVVDSNAVCGGAPTVAVNDVDGNGLYDIVAISVNNPLQEGTVKSARLYSNFGDGYYFVAQDFTATLNAYNVAWHSSGSPIRLEDINRDGNADLIVVSSHGQVSEVLAFLANPPGQTPGFQVPPLTLIPDTFANRPIADFGVSASGGSTCVTTDGGVSLGMTGLAVEDFDGDTYFDIVLTSPSERKIERFLNNGDNTFSRQRPLAFGIGGGAFAYAYDYDGDGSVDLGIVRSGLGCGGAPGDVRLWNNPNNDFDLQLQATTLFTTGSTIDWAAALKQQIFNSKTNAPETFIFGFILGQRMQNGNYTEWYNIPSTAYNLTGSAQAATMYSGITAQRSIVSAQLNNYSSQTPGATTITLSVSPDNGVHWESLTPAEVAGQVHPFQNFGQQFQWRVKMTSPAAQQTGANAVYMPAATLTPGIASLSFTLNTTDARTYSRSGLAYGTLPGVGNAPDQSYVYSASFAYPGFWGKLTATNISNATVGDANGLQTVTTTPQWDAGAVLAGRSGGTRSISAGYPATTARLLGNTNVVLTTPIDFSANELTAGSGKNPNLTQLLKVATSQAAVYVNFVRGGYNDPLARKFYNPGHSSPVFVGPPSQDPNFMGAGYASYATSQKTRSPVVLQGANDGMLHAFDAATGGEKWGFIPYNLLGKLQNNVSYTGANRSVVFGHDSFVDGPITVGDVYSANLWHTIAIFGQGQGQGLNRDNYYTAVDISDPAKPLPLWEMTETYSGRDSKCSGDPCDGYGVSSLCTNSGPCTTQNTAYNAAFDVGKSTPDASGQPAGLLEAEHFDSMYGSADLLQDNWQTISGAGLFTLSARQNAYIESQGLTPTCPGTTTAAKQKCTQVTYRFNVAADSAGNYFPMFRINNIGGTLPALAWGIDGVYIWSGNLTPSSIAIGWQWMNSISTPLTPGEHTLNVWMTNTGLDIDTVALQKQTFLPPSNFFKETPSTTCQFVCSPYTTTPYCVPNPSTSEWPACGRGLGLKCCTSGADNYCYPKDTPCPAVVPSVMGQSFSAPAIGRFATTAGDAWLAFFASGYDSFAAPNVGRSVYAINAFTGVVAGTWNFPDISNPPTNPTIDTTIPAGGSMVDMDSDGYVDRVYIGDLAGRMWKIDTSKKVALSAGRLTSTTDYPACIVFDAGDPQQSGARTWAPIATKAAAVVFDSNTVNIYFGTGGDRNAPINQNYRFYSVRDLDSRGQCLTRNRKVSNFTTNNAEWFLSDPNRGNRFYSDPTVVNGSSVYFSSYSGDVDSVNPCAITSAGSNVYGVATRNFLGANGVRYTVGNSVLAGGKRSLLAQGMVRTAAVQAGVTAPTVARQVKTYSAAPTDLYMQQYTGEILRLSAPGVMPLPPMRLQRWREVPF